MKKMIKVTLYIFIFLFCILYFSYQNGYYINKNKDKTLLTEEKIKEYEEDLKNGVDVTKKDYIVVSDTYDNSYTRFSLSVSKKIEKCFDKIIKYFFNKMGMVINN